MKIGNICDGKDSFFYQYLNINIKKSILPNSLKLPIVDYFYQSRNPLLDGYRCYYYCKKRDTQGCESILSMKGYEEKAAVDMLYIQL